MKDFIEQFENEVNSVLALRKKRREEYSQLLVSKKEEIEAITKDIDEALSEDNLEKVEQLTIRKAGLETFLRTLEERRGALDSPTQKREYERKGSEMYHALAESLKLADEKELEKCKAHLYEAFKIAKEGASRCERAQGVLSKWTNNLSTIDNASSVSISSELKRLYEQLERLLK